MAIDIYNTSCLSATLEILTATICKQETRAASLGEFGIVVSSNRELRAGGTDNSKRKAGYEGWQNVAVKSRCDAPLSREAAPVRMFYWLAYRPLGPLTSARGEWSAAAPKNSVEEWRFLTVKGTSDIPGQLANRATFYLPVSLSPPSFPYWTRRARRFTCSPLSSWLLFSGRSCRPRTLSSDPVGSRGPGLHLLFIWRPRSFLVHPFDLFP